MTYRHHLVAFADVLGINVTICQGPRGGPQMLVCDPRDMSHAVMNEASLENLICEILHAKHSAKEQPHD